MLFAALFGLSAAAAALAQPAPKAPPATSDNSPIYGCMLMTPQERTDFRARMRAATTPQQREAIRLEHHKQMQERAKQRGVTLPDMPAAGRCPMGAGMGPGMMGPGNGMGPGMMGPGAGKGMGPGMMGAGTGTGPGTMGPGAGRGMGPGMMGPARTASAATPAPATSTDGGH
ncbi:MAG TPA: hypothetical protein VF216_07780 [Mizugakiibacter sp.]